MATNTDYLQTVVTMDAKNYQLASDQVVRSSYRSGVAITSMLGTINEVSRYIDKLTAGIPGLQQLGSSFDAAATGMIGIANATSKAEENTYKLIAAVQLLKQGYDSVKSVWDSIYNFRDAAKETERSVEKYAATNYGPTYEDFIAVRHRNLLKREGETIAEFKKRAQGPEFRRESEEAQAEYYKEGGLGSKFARFAPKQTAEQTEYNRELNQWAKDHPAKPDKEATEKQTAVRIQQDTNKYLRRIVELNQRQLDLSRTTLGGGNLAVNGISDAALAGMRGSTRRRVTAIARLFYERGADAAVDILTRESRRR